MKILTLPKTSSQEVSGWGESGFHDLGSGWWSDPVCGLRFYDLDPMYKTEYFAGNHHPSIDDAKRMLDYMQQTYAALFGKSFDSVLELGTGGGEFTRVFRDAGLDYLAVEGTNAGREKMRSLGIPDGRVVAGDIRRLPNDPRFNARFDLTVCTEVAEHVEPWFASKVVEECTAHSDVVWFSAARPARPPHRGHYHHPNEAPIEAWDRLFAFMDFPHRVDLNGLLGRADRVYLSERAKGRALCE